jgi:hypothetical protein
MIIHACTSINKYTHNNSRYESKLPAPRHGVVEDAYFNPVSIKSIIYCSPIFSSFWWKYWKCRTSFVPISLRIIFWPVMTGTVNQYLSPRTIAPHLSHEYRPPTNKPWIRRVNLGSPPNWGNVFLKLLPKSLKGYRLVMTNIAMENHHAINR